MTPYKPPPPIPAKKKLYYGQDIGTNNKSNSLTNDDEAN